MYSAKKKKKRNPIRKTSLAASKVKNGKGWRQNSFLGCGKKGGRYKQMRGRSCRSKKKGKGRDEGCLLRRA